MCFACLMAVVAFGFVLMPRDVLIRWHFAVKRISILLKLFITAKLATCSKKFIDIIRFDQGNLASSIEKPKF